jgi:hypothetical protein
LREPSIQVVPFKYSRLEISLKEAFSPPNTTKLPKEKNPYSYEIAFFAGELSL